jgi:DNA-binding transcriptional LysR family regulator
MKHYEFTDRFRALYDQSVQRYAAGQRGADSFFDTEARAFLAANGLRTQDLYDYAEDQLGGGEPGYDRALAIELVRRDYFLNVQGGRPGGRVLDDSTLPPKDAAVEGIGWLPRLIPKTKAKLRGELPVSLMYSCGGDRRFFKEHDIHPAEFLSLVWRHEQDDAAVVRWVIARSRAR